MSLFGLNQDYTGRTACTIDRSGCRIFQYLDRRYIGRVYIAHIFGDDSIHYDEGIGRTVDGADTTYGNLHFFTRNTTAGLGLHTGQLTGEGITQIGDRTSFNGFGGHLGYGSRQIAFLHGAVTHYHYFIQ